MDGGTAIISLRKALVLFVHSLVVWIVCGATIGIGRTFLTLDATLAVHAVVAPAVSAFSAFVYVKRFNCTTPSQTALAFVAFALIADAGLVAPVFEKSYAMFASVWGTWIPLASIFLAAFTVATLARTQAARSA